MEYVSFRFSDWHTVGRAKNTPARWRGGGSLVESFQLLEVFAGGVDVFVDEALEPLIGLAHLSGEGA